MIDSESSTPTEGTILRYNIINNATGDEGIQLRAVTDGTIEYNHMFDIAQDGINMCCGTTGGTIQFNEVHDNSSENAAIYIYDADLMTIECNLVYDVYDNDGIKLGDKGGDDVSRSGGSILYNTVYNTVQDGITVYMSDVTVEGNDVSLSSSENGAIYVAYGVSNISIIGNNVHDNTLDAGKWGDPGAIMIGSAVDTANVSVNNNNITGNSVNGVTNTTAALLDAEDNWWGAVDGPGLPGGTGSGDSVSTNVDFDPWLAAAETIVNPCAPDNEGPPTTNVMADPNPVEVNGALIITANVDDTDTGGSNIKSAEYSLDGGVTWDPMDAQDGFFDEVSEDVEATGVYAPSEAGIYDLCVRGTDDADNTGPMECIMVVVYDPSGGFVTGGGWIDSPEDAVPIVEAPTFFNGFETDTDGWVEFVGTIARVSSGTNGVTSADGGWHAEVTVGPSNGNGAFTRFGGYSIVFPPGGFRQLVDVYIDPSMGDIGNGWALDNALNGNDGAWEEAGGVGALKATDGNWWLTADADGAGYLGPPGGGVGLKIDTAGWYTIESQWVENTTDPSMIDRNTFIYNSSGTLLYSNFNLQQVALADAGGHRYGWFLDPNGPDWPPIGFALPIDNSRLVQFVGVTGKANFGFVSKYKKGASIPTGSTEFQFKAGDLNFHSDSYEWLLVTGGNFAKYKGKGTINGDLAPNGELFKFILWAGDGTGPSDEDTFRIKIWYEVDNVEIVVYDNGMNQPISGGSIVVHTKK
jgi:hypothetical protein